jgi:hypothetical protein
MEVAPGKLKDTIVRSDTKNYVFRGKLITLNKERTIHMCFDTELMRVAGVWKGPYPGGVSEKNMGPTVEGTMLLQSKPGPGWARKGEWKDPRDGAEGPLPADWARFRGLHCQGDKTVLEYTIGTTSVLELDEAHERDGCVVLTRTFEIGPSNRPLRLKIGSFSDSSQETKPELRFAPLDSDAGVPGVWIVVDRSRDGKLLGAILARGTVKHISGSIEQGEVIVDVPELPRGASIQIAALIGCDKQMENVSKEVGQIPVLQPLVKGGPARWKDELVTRGTLGKADKSPYVLDMIELPEKNPWNASVRFAGIDFFPDGRAAISTWDGDVWIVSGLDSQLGKVRWKRFATGLQHPLGLKIVNGQVYTAGRDQITRLVDLNGDGEADFYENVNNEPGLTLQRHEFVMGLDTDPKGNFYFSRSGHYVEAKTKANCVVYKMTPDGKKLDVFARGFREPNGVCVGPDGLVTVSDNEGNGIPQSPIYRVQEGHNYGYKPNPYGSVKEGGSWKETEKPIVWLPKHVDSSSAAQVWAPATGWGPLSGQLLHTSYSNCSLFALLIDKTAEPWQGAVWKFPVTFPSGLMRARFNPADGQLYVCGLRGWGTTGTSNGVLARIRYEGSQLPVPVGFEVVKNGLKVTFSGPLDRKRAEDEQSYSGTWATGFKSERADLPIDSATLSPDGKSATVVLETMRPVVNFTLKYDLRSAKGERVTGELNGTINRVP